MKKKERKAEKLSSRQETENRKERWHFNIFHLKSGGKNEGNMTNKGEAAAPMLKRIGKEFSTGLGSLHNVIDFLNGWHKLARGLALNCPSVKINFERI